MTGPGLWDIVGPMTDIKKALDLTYLRGQLLALYTLRNKMQETINKIEAQIKEGENDNNKL